MWSLKAPAAVLGLVAIALLPATSAKPYPVHINDHEERELYNASQVIKRQCAGTPCGYYGQLCCTGGQSCFTDGNNQAQCGPANANGVTEGWVYFTTTWVESEVATHTSVYSSYVGAAPNAQPTAACTDSQNPCGSLCCDSGFYCKASGTCALIGGGSSGGIIATGSPTATVPFETPIATGQSGAPMPVEEGGGGGLSGGAIAGIVIGVLLGLLLLLLICLFCCARALFDSILAIFGIGKRKKHTHEETYIEEHHHGSAAAGGRRWYGAGPARPPREKKSGISNAMGIAGILGATAVALGLKRKHDRRHDDKSTTVSGSSYYYSDYTSSSSASSSDRHTRRTRHSSRR